MFSGGILIGRNMKLPRQFCDSDCLSIFTTPTNCADDYGTRARGYIKPPYGGNYTSWIARDNRNQLWLSSDYDPAKAMELPGLLHAWRTSVDAQMPTPNLDYGS
jgi:hypothetical protein